MFKVSTSPTFWARVKLRMAGEDGKVVEGDIRVQFYRKSRDDLKGLIEKTAGKEVAASEVEPLIAGWKEYDDGSGPTEYSPEALKRLEQMVPGSPLAILNAFLSASAGAREGN